MASLFSPHGRGQHFLFSIFDVRQRVFCPLDRIVELGDAVAELECDLAVLRRTRSLVREIGDRTGSVVYFREVGGLEVAADRRTGDYLQAQAGRMRSLASDVTILSAAEVATRWPQKMGMSTGPRTIRT